MRLLVDSTVWIDFFHGKETIQTEKAAQGLENRDDLCTCGFILTEVFWLAKDGRKKEILTMTSTVTSKGQTVVPKALRERFNIKSGATLDWQEEGASLRVIKLEPRRAGSFLEGLRRLGRVPAGPRDKRPVKTLEEE